MAGSLADEPELVSQVARGDRDAFTTLAGHYLPVIGGYAVRMLQVPSAAEDVAQETLLRLWLKAGNYNSQKSSLSTWLHQIAYHLCVDYLRLRGRFAAETDPPTDDPTTHTDAIYTANETDAKLRQALSELPLTQRTALILTYYQGLTNREVAEIMGVSVRALESLLVRARQRLRRCMEEEI